MRESCDEDGSIEARIAAVCTAIDILRRYYLRRCDSATSKSETVPFEGLQKLNDNMRGIHGRSFVVTNL